MKVMMYGSLGEAFGREVTIDVPPGTSVEAVRRRLVALRPEAEALLIGGGVRAAIDDQIVGDEAEVPTGAELAFLPPLSGG